MDEKFFLILLEGIKKCNQDDIFYPLVVHFVSGMVGHISSYIAATLCLTGVGIGLPSLLSTPISVALVMYLCSSPLDWLDSSMCYAQGVGIHCACVLATIIWLAPFIISGKDFLRDAEVIMKPYDELFIEPTWNNIFYDQHLVLNYQPDGFICAHKLLTTYSGKGSIHTLSFLSCLQVIFLHSPLLLLK